MKSSWFSELSSSLGETLLPIKERGSKTVKRKLPLYENSFVKATAPFLYFLLLFKMFITWISILIFQRIPATISIILISKFLTTSKNQILILIIIHLFLKETIYTGYHPHPILHHNMFRCISKYTDKQTYQNDNYSYHHYETIPYFLYDGKQSHSSFPAPSKETLAQFPNQ